MSFNTSSLLNETVGVKDKVDAHFVRNRPSKEAIKSWNILEWEEIPKDH